MTPDAAQLHIPYSGVGSERATVFECAACHQVVHSRDSAATLLVWAESPRQCTRWQIPRMSELNTERASHSKTGVQA